MAITPGGLSEGIAIGVFLSCSDEGGRLVDPTHQLGEGVPEQAGDSQGHIHPGAAQGSQWNQFDVHEPAAGPIPDRSDPHQREALGDVFPAIAHRAGAPDRKREVA